MTICGVVVLYNPDMDVYDNISTYLYKVNKLYVCDNSDKVNLELLDKLRLSYNVEIINMNGNQGIAKALRVGLDNAVAANYDFCLTMDQDSRFQTDRFDDMISYLSMPTIDEYGIISASYIKKDSYEHRLIETKYLITSGNFINVKNYKLTDGFMIDLFIDYVDLEMCEQFYNIGKKLAYVDDIVLEHNLGNILTKKILFKTLKSMNHTPLRYYYRYRNCLYLYRRNKTFYKEKYKEEKKNIIIMMLVEKNRKAKRKMIRLGRKDAKKGILGKYNR